MHEIGHTLGLDHSNHPDAIMYPIVNPGINKRELRADDINGLEGLYSSPIREDSSAVALRFDYYHLLIIAVACLLIMFVFFDITNSEFFD